MIKKQKGFTLVVAVFVLVILSLLAVSMINITAISKATLINAIQGNRAYYAARSGLEWQVYKIENERECPADSVINLNQGAFPGFEVNVTCTKEEFLEDPYIIKIFTLTSKSSSGSFGNENYTSREVVMSMYLPDDIV